MLIALDKKKFTCQQRVQGIKLWAIAQATSNIVQIVKDAEAVNKRLTSRYCHIT